MSFFIDLLQMSCNNTEVQKIKEKLAANGCRMTKQRQEIFAVLSHHPQSVLEIAEKLNKKAIKIDKVTVYRSLDNFVKLGLAAATQFKDKVTVYELADHDHHHHIVCEKCGKVEDVCLDENLLMKAVKKLSSFEITNHHLEFFGFCRHCQNKKQLMRKTK